MQILRPVAVQQQKQKLSAQMIQTIRLIAMPAYELREEIQHAVETNPALEVVSDHSLVSLESLPLKTEAEAEVINRFEDSSDDGFIQKENSDAKRMFMEGTVSRAETLQDYLLWQLRLQPLSELHGAIGELLIQNLDSDGFHKEDPYQVCMKYDADDISAVIHVIRHLDPIGVCVNGYRDSLLVQALASPELPAGVPEILQNHFEELERGSHKNIQNVLGLTEQETNAALAFIKMLNPFPGRQYAPLDTRYVIPDARVTLKDGEFVIIINDDIVPVLGIAPFFNQLAAKKPDKETQRFVETNIRSAQSFISGLKQRRDTLLKLIRALVEFQRSFFARGPKYLVPLTMSDIAKEIGVHETTVSRIAGKKYLQTDWGLFEIRHFFTNSISGMGSSGSRFSKGGVKERIREIITASDTVLSDQKICDMLAGGGIRIARRTVAKYRAEINIDSSVGRRRR